MSNHVRQKCVMSAVLFNVIIERVLRRTTKIKRRRICWTLSTVLEDMNYADGIAFLSHSPNTMQETLKFLTDVTKRRPCW